MLESSHEPERIAALRIRLAAGLPLTIPDAAHRIPALVEALLPWLAHSTNGGIPAADALMLTKRIQAAVARIPVLKRTAGGDDAQAVMARVDLLLRHRIQVAAAGARTRPGEHDRDDRLLLWLVALALDTNDDAGWIPAEASMHDSEQAFALTPADIAALERFVHRTMYGGALPDSTFAISADEIPGEALVRLGTAYSLQRDRLAADETETRERITHDLGVLERFTKYVSTGQNCPAAREDVLALRRALRAAHASLAQAPRMAERAELRRVLSVARVRIPTKRNFPLLAFERTHAYVHALVQATEADDDPLRIHLAYARGWLKGVDDDRRNRGGLVYARSFPEPFPAEVQLAAVDAALERAIANANEGRSFLIASAAEELHLDALLSLLEQVPDPEATT